MQIRVARPTGYWERTGALCFVDPDGYGLILSPEDWAAER